MSAHPWGSKESFGDLKSPKTPLLTASFLRPNVSGHTVEENFNNFFIVGLLRDKELMTPEEQEVFLL